MLKRFHSDELGSFYPHELVATAGFGLMAAEPPARLFGLDLRTAKLVDTAREIVAMATAREMVTIQFVNAHCVNVARRDPAYRDALAAADFLLPDGSGIAIAARLAGQATGENLNGTDLFPLLCDRAAAARTSIYLLGGRAGVAAAAAHTMLKHNPQLRVAGTRHGFWTAAEEDALIDDINESGADILLIGLGVPLQEKWIARVRHRLAARVVMGVGGLFDYYSGTIPRAPLPIRKLGCEWIWRLAQEPRRLFSRYVIGNPLFLIAALGNAWEARGLGRHLSDIGKRGFDLASATAALVMALPLFLFVALAIKLEDGGPVFFRQTRIGAGGTPFRMWKFRSMVTDAEARLAAIRAQSDREGNRLVLSVFASGSSDLGSSGGCPPAWLAGAMSWQASLSTLQGAAFLWPKPVFLPISPSSSWLMRTVRMFMCLVLLPRE